MEWTHWLPVSGVVGVGIIIYAIYRKMKKGELDVFKTEELKIDDLKTWVEDNDPSHNTAVYLFYGSEGHLMADSAQIEKNLINFLKRKDESIFDQSNDFIAQILYNEDASSVKKCRIIVFNKVEKALNDIFEENHFYSKGLIRLT